MKYGLHMHASFDVLVFFCMVKSFAT